MGWNLEIMKELQVDDLLVFDLPLSLLEIMKEVLQDPLIRTCVQSPTRWAGNYERTAARSHRKITYLDAATYRC